MGTKALAPRSVELALNRHPRWHWPDGRSPQRGMGKRWVRRHNVLPEKGEGSSHRRFPAGRHPMTARLDELTSTT